MVDRALDRAVARRQRLKRSVDMTSVVKGAGGIHGFSLRSCSLRRRSRVREEARPLMTTVDPADIRGLGTTLVFPSSACLGLESRVGLGRLITLTRVAPTGTAPLPRPCRGS